MNGDCYSFELSQAKIKYDSDNYLPDFTRMTQWLETQPADAVQDKRIDLDSWKEELGFNKTAPITIFKLTGFVTSEVDIELK